MGKQAKVSIAQHIIEEAIAAPHGGMEAVAQRHGVPYNTLRRIVSEQKRGVSGVYAPFPEPEQLVNVPPLQINTDTFAFICDAHCPSYSKLMFRRLVQVTEHLGIDTLVIGGDWFDMSSISRHGRFEAQSSVDKTIEVAGKLLDALLDYYERIYILPGNHDDRVVKKLDDVLSFEKLVRAGVTRGQVSSNPDSDAPIVSTDNCFMYIGNEETGWVAGHPLRYSRTPVALSKAAMRERRSILTSHTHLQSLIWSDDGRYRIVECGMMADANNIPYQARTKGISTFCESKNGFVIVRENIPAIFADGLVRWSEYGAS